MSCNDRKKVVLGLSGGVDSTAAALLLKHKGYEVTGVYIDVLGNNPDGEKHARKTANEIGIDLVFADASKDFHNIVIANFCSEYMNGRTPNPCIVCNPEVKFKYLLNVADERGAFFIATGHYANIVFDKDESCHFISKAKNIKKDQSYMLYRLNKHVLSRLIFPLGEFEKKEDVRSFVGKKGINNAERKDSQEICFIPDDVHYMKYLEAQGYVSVKGNFINCSGEVIGEHKGVPNYTIGQRKHLGMTFGKPMFVVKLDNKTNEVMLGGQEELFESKVITKLNKFTISDEDKMPDKYFDMKVTAKARYAAPPEEAVLTKIDDNTVSVVFSKPQRAITPGQSVVFYAGDKVVGGGIIA